MDSPAADHDGAGNLKEGGLRVYDIAAQGHKSPLEECLDVDLGGPH